MGSSFALALRKKGYKGRITGIGRNRNNLVKAKRRRIINDYSTDPAQGIKDADLVLLAVPVGRFETIVKGMRHALKKGAVVTDVGSVKAEIVRKIEPLMPEGVDFVGAHPIAGRECSGIECATADLYQNALCIITPSAKTRGAALRKIKELWKSVGARTVIMTPQEHDVIYAAVSHLPHVVAYALVNSISRTRKGILHNGGRGLRDMTRIALSSSEMWRDICAYNRAHLLATLRRFTSSVAHLTRLIENSNWSALEKEFIKAKKARQVLESD